MAVFRAVENRVPVVRAANTGISGFIDSRGRVLEMSGIFEEAILTRDIKTGSGLSFYASYGDIFAYACLFSVCLIVLRRIFIIHKGLS
jgi:apolipoprotein N-acyltransferase